MEIKRKNLLSMSIMGILLSSLIIPAYAEVQSVKTDSLFYSIGDKIIFSGTVDDNSSGLVTIVIRDSNDKFVLLTQAVINADNTFERSLTANEKFTDHGIYNVTAFLVNMTEGSLTRFDFSKDGSAVFPSVSNVVPIVPVIQEPPVTTSTEPLSKIASFVDQTKDPQYYIDRYNNESAYKKWFDTNFPEQSIHEVVGAQEPKSNNTVVNSTIIEPPVTTQESSTSKVESSTVNPNIDSGSAEFGQMLLALGGLGILFGAVYGVKRRVDTNTEQIQQNKTKLEKKVVNNFEQISQNRFWLKKKLMSLKPNDEPVSVIKERLAKGEINVDEYYKLLRALKK